MNHPTSSGKPVVKTLQHIEDFLLDMGKNPYEQLSGPGNIASLSLRSNTHEPSQEFIQEALKSIRVLLIDDNEVNQNSVRHLLEEYQMNVLTATRYLEAIRMVRNEPFDLVVMSLQLPGVEIEKLIRQIRAMPQASYSLMPILAFTASNIGPSELLNMGLNGKIGKPLARNEMETVFLNVLFN